jgi:MFS family permease
VHTYLPAATLDGLVEALWLFTLGWEASRAGWAAGFVLAAGALPSLIFILWGGHLADRLGAHRVALWTMLARVVVMAAWAGVVMWDASPAYMAAATAAAVGAIAGIHDPAVSAMPVLLVPEAGIEASQNAQRLLIRLVQGAGPILGGALAAIAGTGSVVIVATAIGIIPLAGFATLRRKLPTPDIDVHADESGWTTALAGLAWVRKQPGFRFTVPLQGVVGLTTAAIVMASLPRQARIYGWGPGIYGLATGVFGVGLLLGGALAFRVRDRWPHRKGLVAVMCAGASSAFVAGTGLAQSPVQAVLGAGLMGLALGPVGSILTGWTVRSAAAADPALVGRVWSVLLLVTTAAEPLGFLVFSGLAAAGGVPTAALVFGAAGVIMSAITLATPAVRYSEAS